MTVIKQWKPDPWYSLKRWRGFVYYFRRMPEKQVRDRIRVAWIISQ